MAFNFPKRSFEIQSRKTGKAYIFIRADDILLSEAAIFQIAKVCDESEIYDNVFSDIFRGKRYTEENARTFIKLVSEGWANGSRFDWLILHEGAIVGTIGIKSLGGDIGYWQSSKHPGVMTLVAKILCSQARVAGFTSLWAYVKKTNIASIKVLEGAGFKRDEELRAKREDVYSYTIKFRPNP